MTSKIRSHEVEARRLMLVAAAEQWESDLGVTQWDRFETPWASRDGRDVSIGFLLARSEGEAIP